MNWDYGRSPPTHTVSGYYGAWSPDGTKIVYGLGGYLYTIPATGGTPTQIWPASPPSEQSWQEATSPFSMALPSAS
jgi:Tol biopolymer transport system component